MNFECLLLSAKAGNEDAITAILQMYRPLLLKYAIIDGVLDEDLYQELSIILLKAISLFRISVNEKGSEIITASEPFLLT